MAWKSAESVLERCGVRDLFPGRGRCSGSQRPWKRAPARVAFAGLAVVFGLLVVRLYRIQIIEGEKFSRAAARMQVREKEVSSRRGDLISSDGRLLAREIKVPYLVIDPGQIAELSQVGDVTYEDILFVFRCLLGKNGVSKELESKLLDHKRRYLVVCDPLSEEQVRLLGSISLPGLHVRYRPERSYPFGSWAANMIGCTSLVDREGRRVLKGATGLELCLDEALGGSAGHGSYLRDNRGRLFSRPDSPGGFPRDGLPVQLTIDSVIQSAVEKALDNLMERCVPAKAQVVIARPDGRILAAGCRPTFDPADKKTLSMEQTKLLPLLENFEPGSTFKPILASLFLQYGFVSLQDQFLCDSPYRGPYRRKPVTNYHNRSLGRLDLMNILRLSSNVGMARMIERADPSLLREKLSELGFGSRCLPIFPHEESGIFPDPEEWGKDYNLYPLSQGYWMNVTSLQMIRAYCALATGGKLPRLRVIEGGLNPSPQRVLSESVCAVIRRAMGMVVESGTARGIHINGYRIGGKTGTANIQRSGARGYSNKVRCSFAGIAPIDEPRLVFICVVEDPSRGGRTGGAVAAPVMEEALNAILPYVMAEGL